MRSLLKPLVLGLCVAPLSGCEEVPLDPSRADAVNVALVEEARRLADTGGAAADVPRVGGLERQYGAAIARVAETHGAERAAALLGKRERLLEGARAAARAGQRSAAQAGFEEARREQIRVVLDVMGAGSAAALLAAAHDAAELATRSVERAHVAGTETDSHRRMLRSANELLVRANAAFDDGDAGAALDLAGHAAGLIDTIRSRLARID